MNDSNGHQGGLGGDSTGEVGTTRDTRMEERAIRQRWPIDDETRKKVIERMAGIITTGSAKRREKIAAARAIIAAEAQNQADELKVVPSKIDVNHGGQVQVYIPDNSRDIPQRQTAMSPIGDTNGNGHHNGNGKH